MFKKQNYRAAYALLAFLVALILSKFGYAGSPDNLLLGGISFVGVGDIEEVTKLIKQQGEEIIKFKDKYDERLKKNESDLLNVAKKANRLNLMGSSEERSHESKNDLADYIRSRGEVKSMYSSSGPDGGWTVQPALAEGIDSILRNQSVLRELVNFVQIENGDRYEEIISTTPVGAKWVGEKESRPGTATPKLVKVTTILSEEYAEPVISQRLADDSSTAMVDFLTEESGISFAEAEESALFYGDGINKPRGLATVGSSLDTDNLRDFGVIQHLPFNTLSFDDVKKLFYALRTGYRKNAKWVCNSDVALSLSLLKNGQGDYLWDDSGVKNGEPPTLLGKPVVICEAAPAMESGSQPLWFGDWTQAIRGIERPGNKVLIDQFSDKPNLIVYVYRRVGMQLRNSNAIKCLKMS